LMFLRVGLPLCGLFIIRFSICLTSATATGRFLDLALTASFGGERDFFFFGTTSLV